MTMCQRTDLICYEFVAQEPKLRTEYRLKHLKFNYYKRWQTAYRCKTQLISKWLHVSCKLNDYSVRPKSDQVFNVKFWRSFQITLYKRLIRWCNQSLQWSDVSVTNWSAHDKVFDNRQLCTVTFITSDGALMSISTACSCLVGHWKVLMQFR